MSQQNPGFSSHGLWVCDVIHQRQSPKKHRFTNRLFWFGLNLSRLASLPQWLGLLSCETPALIRYRDKDFFPSSPQGTAAERVSAYLVQHSANIPSDSSVMLFGQLRTAGYLFNPISLYVVISPQEEPLCALAEVTNTFYERKSFIIPRHHWDPENQTAQFDALTPKYFYVSPFSDLNLNFEFSFTLTPTSMSLTVSSINSEKQAQISTCLSGHFQPLSLSAVVKQFGRFPLLPQQIISGIHWQAFCLWLKRIPYHRKEENPEWQIDRLRQ